MLGSVCIDVYYAIFTAIFRCGAGLQRGKTYRVSVQLVLSILSTRHSFQECARCIFLSKAATELHLSCCRISSGVFPKRV